MYPLVIYRTKTITLCLFSGKCDQRVACYCLLSGLYLFLVLTFCFGRLRHKSNFRNSLMSTPASFTHAQWLFAACAGSLQRRRLAQFCNHLCRCATLGSGTSMAESEVSLANIFQRTLLQSPSPTFSNELMDSSTSAQPLYWKSGSSFKLTCLYHIKWKTVVSFHLRIRSTLLSRYKFLIITLPSVILKPSLLSPSINYGHFPILEIYKTLS